MTDKEMTTFVKNYLAAINSHDLRLQEKFYSKTCVSASGGQPAEGLTRDARSAYFSERLKAFPDFKIKATKIRSEPEASFVAFDWTITATHEGLFKGVAPTHRRVKHKGTTELFIEENKIVREVSYQDLAAFMKQLGVGSPQESLYKH